jgi:hypothetical protein
VKQESSLPRSQEPPLVPILNQNNPFRPFPADSFMIHSNIILPLRLGFPSGTFPFSHKTLYVHLLSLKNATFAVSLILLDSIIRKIFGFETVIVKTV